MRATFIRTLTELAEEDRRVVLLTGDLGFMVIEPFAERCPDQFVNVGAAEQNMVGVATGLAESGFIPFVYSIVTFASLRAYEFIRNGPVLHQLPVRIVAVGGGFEYGHAGPTHHGIEDVAVMRTQPGITVIAPADHLQADLALRATWDAPGPVYYRLGKDEVRTVDGPNRPSDIGEAWLAREGNDVAIVAMGAISTTVMSAAAVLERQGVDCTVVVVSTVSPAPVDDLVAILARHHTVVTVEAHSVIGGVGSLVCEVVAEAGLACRVVRCGVRTRQHLGGSEAYLNDVHGLSVDKLVHTIRTAVRAGVYRRSTVPEGVR